MFWQGRVVLHLAVNQPSPLFKSSKIILFVLSYLITVKILGLELTTNMKHSFILLGTFRLSTSEQKVHAMLTLHSDNAIPAGITQCSEHSPPTNVAQVQ